MAPESFSLAIHWTAAQDMEGDFEWRAQGVGSAMNQFIGHHPVTADVLGFGTITDVDCLFSDDALSIVSFDTLCSNKEGHQFRVAALLGVSHQGTSDPLVEDQTWRVNRIAVTVDHLGDTTQGDWERIRQRTVVVDMVASSDMVMACAIMGAYSDGLDYLLSPEEVTVLGKKKYKKVRRKPRKQDDSEQP